MSDERRWKVVNGQDQSAIDRVSHTRVVSYLKSPRQTVSKDKLTVRSPDENSINIVKSEI